MPVPTLLSLVLVLTSTDRDLAAEHLRSALADPAREADRLEASAEAALAALGDSRAAARLRERLARDEPLVDVLQRSLDELTFEPLIEADLPVGWPAPTALEEIEVKRYPVTRLARASMDSGSTYGPFWSLFRHIEERDIPMTAPVEMALEGDTAREIAMGFLYQGPDVGRLEDDGTVEVLDAPPAVYVSLGLRGRTTPERVESALAELHAYVAEHEHLSLATSAVEPLTRTLGYNSPMVPTSRRYFEVQLMVEDSTLVDFSAPGEAQRWTAIDDRVMGGVSESRLRAAEGGTCVFEGELSLENNGGFASVRSGERAGLSEDATALVLRVRGDGKTYQLRLRTTAAFDGPSYTAAFETVAGEWTDVRLELADFRCVFRGRDVAGAPALSPGDVRTFGLMLSDGQVGPFALELDWIRVLDRPASGREGSGSDDSPEPTAPQRV